MSKITDAIECLSNNGLDSCLVTTIAQNLMDNDSFEDNDDRKQIALIIHTDGTICDESSYDDCTFTDGSREYLVLDEDEVESRIDDSLENYLDEGCVEGADSPYFDREKWKNDARMDGAGHILSSYDGNEYEYADLTVFRIN